MLALTGAVQYAHERGVIHRDIKPANILTMQDGWIKLSDFGLAKHLTPESMSASGNVVGTPAYMAPEQAEGRSADIGPATDVYALGVVFYEMLTGRPPFQGSSALAIMRDLCSVPPPLPSELDPTIDAELERICLRCLEKSPSRRFPSAAALGQDLRSFEAENATQCRSGQPARRHVRRRLLMGATVAAVILLGTLVLARVSGFLRLPQRDANAPMASAPLPEGALRIAAGDDLDQIIDQCTQQVHMHPDDAEAYLRRAVATYYKTLHEPDVIADCSKALELHPNLAAAFAFRAGARTDLGQLEAALQDCNSSLASDATCSYAYAFRALAKVNANELDAALADCVDALRLDPNLALAYNHRGIALLRLGEYRQAIAAFSEAIRLQPQFVWPYHHRAMCHLNTRQYDECIADETQALRLSPTWYRSFQNRGRAFLEKGDFAAAVRDLTEATRLDPTDAFTWKIRGDTHRAKGDLASARNSYRTARKIDPQITVPEFDVAAMVLQAEKAFERDDLDAAERGFRDVLVLEPKHAQAHDRLGWIFLERHDRKSEKAFLESALLHFNQAINNAPAYSSAFHGRARTRWELKQPKEAIEDISSAIRCAPKEPMLFRERGDRYLETGDRARALDDYASMIAIEPKNPDHYEYRAGILKDIGQSVAAEKDIAKAKELRKTPK
jgi:tetratricopeptide (TPR) repeat protein